MRNFFFFNLVLLFSSLNLLGWGEEVVLYVGVLFFILIGIFLIKNQAFFFYVGKKIDLEKGYFLVFFIKNSRLKGILQSVYSLRVLKMFNLVSLNFLKESLGGLTQISLLEQCGLIYM
jgi:hypothetical protein